MKHIRNMLLLLAAVTLFSCGEDFQDEIDRLNGQYSDIDQRVSKLETQVTAFNAQLTQLSVLAKAVEQGFYITQVKTTGDSYELTLSDGNTLVLQKGANNTLMPAPAISMTQLNGFFYWTLNGMLLNNGGGQPIRTDGLTPIVKYDFISQQWIISMDGGTTFQDINVLTSIVINDEILLQIINNYIEQHRNTFISQDVLYQIITTYIQRNYAELFNIKILDEVVVNYIDQHYTRIFDYQLLEKIFTQYNFGYITNQINVDKLINAIITFIRGHKEIFLNNEVLYEIISNYITVNKTTIFSNELLLEVINTFIENNANFLNTELLTQIVCSYIDQHKDAVFNTETVRTLLKEYVKKYYVQIFSQDILMQITSTYITRNEMTIFDKKLIEEIINDYMQNNYKTVISQETIHDIINNYIKKNSTTIIKRELLVEIITNYFERNYNLIVDVEVIQKEVYDYIERNKTTIIDVDIIRSVINKYLRQYYTKLFSYDMLTQVIHNYFKQNQEEFFQHVVENNDIIRGVKVENDLCTISLKSGTSIRLVVYDSYASLRDRVQSIVVLPNEKGRIDVNDYGYIRPNYLVSPASMAKIIQTKFYKKEIALELKATDEKGNISTFPVYEPYIVSEGVFEIFSQTKSSVKAVALHIKENKPGGTDIMTEFTPIGEEETTTHGHLTCPDDHHPHMIDLGLPSGTLWSCCNVGAEEPEDYGNYYTWGNTKPIQEWYEYASNIPISRPNIGYSNIGIDISSTQHDVAYIKWGDSWRMPTREQCEELIKYCTVVMIEGNEGKYYKLKGGNGGEITIPAAGYLDYIGSGWIRWSNNNSAYFWSSSIGDPTNPSYPKAYSVHITDENKQSYMSTWTCTRVSGNSVRPVAAP